MQTFNKEVLQKKKEVNWFMPIFHTLCSDLRNVAKMVRLVLSYIQRFLRNSVPIHSWLKCSL